MFLKALKIIALVFTFFIALAALYLWTPDKSKAELEKTYGSSKNAYVSALGVNLHYQDTGPSKNVIPILFLHGFGRSLMQFRSDDSCPPKIRVLHYFSEINPE